MGKVQEEAENLYDDTVGKDSWIGSGEAGGDIVNTAVQYMTLGLAGYDSSTGKIKTGFSGDAIRDAGAYVGDGIKEITGVNAMEEGLELQKQAATQAKKDAEEMRKRQLNFARQQDLAASNAATKFAQSASFYNPADMLGV